MTHKRLTFGSLFAGIGGFDKGFHDAGMRCAWQVEIDGAARSVLARHWPDAERHEDVKACGAANLAPVDIICGGFPCQDLSVAGKRAGLTGARSGLFYEMTRITDELRPMLLVWENVPGLLSSDGGRDFARVLLELERIGYSGCWTTLDAQFFDVAQRRQRVFGVFARRDIGAAVCAEILSLAARLPWNTQKGRAERAGVAAAVAASAGHHGRSSPRGDGSDNLVAYALNSHAGAADADVSNHSHANGGPVGMGVSENLAYSLRGGRTQSVAMPAIAQSNRGQAGDVFETVRAGSHGALPMVASALSASQGGADDNDAQANHLVLSIAENQRGELRTSDVAAQLTNGGGKPGQGYPAVFAFTERTRLEGRTFEAQEDLAYALTNPGSGGRTHSRQIGGGFGVRRLTPRECERLQGFPDDWTAGQPDSTRYRQLGNAVCVSVARWIGQQIVRCV